MTLGIISIKSKSLIILLDYNLWLGLRILSAIGNLLEQLSLSLHYGCQICGIMKFISQTLLCWKSLVTEAKIPRSFVCKQTIGMHMLWMCKLYFKMIPIVFVPTVYVCDSVFYFHYFISSSYWTALYPPQCHLYAYVHHSAKEPGNCEVASCYSLIRLH